LECEASQKVRANEDSFKRIIEIQVQCNGSTRGLTGQEQHRTSR